MLPARRYLNPLFACRRIAWAGLALAVLLLAPTETWADEGSPVPDRRWIVTQWGRTNGLPHDRVDVLLRSHAGYLFAGTPFGLSRFDGIQFTNYTRYNTQALQEDPRVLCLAEEVSGSHLWIGTPHGLVRKSGPLFTRPGADQGLGEVAITALAPAFPRGVWIGSALGVHHHAQGQWTRYPLPEPETGTGKITIHALLEQPEQPGEGSGAKERRSLWAGTSAGLIQLALPDGHWEWVGKSPSGSRREAVHALADGGADGILALSGPTLLRCRRDGRVETRPHPVAGRPLVFAVEGGDQEWLAFDDGTILGPAQTKPVGDGGDGSSAMEGEPGPREPWHLPILEGTGVLSLVTATDGDGVWLGTESRGILRLRPKRVQELRVADGLPSDDVRCVLEDRAGRFWVGTATGLARFARAESIDSGDAPPDSSSARARADVDVAMGVPRGSWKLEALYRSRHGLGAEEITGLAEDLYGRLWIATPAGLHLLVDNNLSLYDLPLPGKNPMTRLHGDPRGLIWGVSGSRLLKWSPETYRLLETDRNAIQTRVRMAMPQVIALPAERRINALASGVEEGELWLGADDGRVGHLSARGSSIDWVARESSGSAIHGLCVTENEDKAGETVWVGSERGLSRYQEGELFEYHAGHGIVEQAIHHIADDRRGRLWITATSKLLRVQTACLNEIVSGDMARATCVLFDRSDGFPEDAVHPIGQKAMMLGSGGVVWLATSQGLQGVSLADEVSAASTSMPRPIIETVWCNGARHFADGWALVRSSSGNSSRSWHPSNEVYLPPESQRNLSISFTATEALAAGQVRFRYRLQGVDPDWIETDTARNVSYGSMPDGRYSFELQAIDKFGKVSEESANLVLLAQPFFHRRPAFYWVLALVVSGGLGFFYRYRVQIISRRHSQAHRAERETITRNLHDDIGGKLAVISALAGRVSRQAADHGALQEQLKNLASEAGETQVSFRDNLWLADPTKDTLDDVLDRLADRVSHVLRQSGIQCNLDLPVEETGLKLTSSQRATIYYGCIEAVTNVIKHSEARICRVSLEVEPKALRLTICDDGKGLEHPVPRADRKDGRGVRTKAASGGSEGRGLAGIRDRVKAVQGEVSFHTGPGGDGCLVQLAIPILMGRAG